MSQINVDTIRSREGIAPSLDKGVIVTGIATASEGYFSGNVTIGGTLTYEDVTNQDVIGLITARSGIKIGNDQDSTGIGITLGTGDIGSASFAGIVTAATCIKVGDGTFGVGIGATILGNGNAVFSGITTSSSFVGDITGDITGNASSATALQTGREIGGVIFDGTGIINLPGVNQSGTQNTSGTAANLSGTPDITVGKITGTAVTFSGITTASGGFWASGVLVESFSSTTTAWNSSGNLNITNGNLQFCSANLGGTSNTLNIISDVGINTELKIGQALNVTGITSVSSSSSYVNALKIDGVTTPVWWVGGSAPSDGGGSGLDTYAFNIIKTGNGTFHVIGNQVKTSS